MATLQKTTLCIFRSITLRRFLKERTLLAVKKRYHLLQFLHKQSLHMTHQRQCNEKMLSTLDIIKTRIKAAGPLTVSEYMSIVLTNSVSVSFIQIICDSKSLSKYSIVQLFITRLTMLTLTYLSGYEV